MIELTDQVYVPVHDYRGNLVSLIDTESGVIAESMRYSAYGEESGNTSISPWRFSSKRIDLETGWVVFHRRYYDPRIGRWTTPDPLYFEDGINRYAYVKNRPMLFIDPYGTKAWGVFDQKPSSFNKWYSFEKYFKNKSGYYKHPGKQSPDLGFSMINGIRCTFSEVQGYVDMISKKLGGNEVHFVYNATHWLPVDAYESFKNIQGYCTTPVQYLHQQWDYFFSTNGKDAHFLQLCHSQGACHVRNALETYDEEARKQIRVLAVAPLTFIDPKTCEKVTHIVSDKDFIPKIDYENREKYMETIKFVEAHPDANQFFDHTFLSPSYIKVINEEIDVFVSDFKNPVNL